MFLLCPFELQSMESVGCGHFSGVIISLLCIISNYLMIDNIEMIEIRENI